MIRKEAEIDVKQTRLDATMQINTMVTKELNNKENELKKAIDLIENKAEEIKGLKSKLEQLEVIYYKK